MAEETATDDEVVGAMELEEKQLPWLQSPKLRL
jgi:hypothetical protein